MTDFDADGVTVQRFNLFGYIDSDAAAEFINALWERDSDDGEAVWEVIVNTEGGDMDSGTAVYSELRSYSERAGGGHYVIVRVRGQASSCGSLIVQAGDWRTAGTMDHIMCHEPLLSHDDAPLQRVRDDVTQAQSWIDSFIDVLMERGSMPRAWYLDKIACGRDWWISAREALEIGMIDEVA